MADDTENRSHLNIPNENIRSEKVPVYGGGTTFKRPNLGEHGRKLQDQASSLRVAYQSKKDYEYSNSLFFEIESPEEIVIKNEKAKLENLGIELIEYNRNRTKAIAKITKDKFKTFDTRLSIYTNVPFHPGKTYFSIIESILDIPFDQKIQSLEEIDKDLEIDVLINLYNVLSKREKKAIQEKLLYDLNQKEIKTSYYTFVNGFTTIQCTASKSIIENICKDYSTIKEVVVNHISFKEQSINMAELPNPLQIQKPLSDSQVAIIDAGINSAAPILNNLITQRIPYLPGTSVNSPNDHGTFVASRCLFGDTIDSCLGTHMLIPFCKVIDVPVFGIDSMGLSVTPKEFDLMKALEDVVIKLHSHVKVYNLSLALISNIKSFEFSPIAKLIDYLSKTYKVLFVISAGNINNLLGTYPTEHFENAGARIGPPAESLLSLTVGSIAKHIDANCLSIKDQLSPFSKRGPGADEGVKPEIVAHGGNLIKAYATHPRIATYGLSNDGLQLAVDNGTSFSAPLIAQYALRLYDAYPNSDANLVKALLCHFCNQCSIPAPINIAEKYLIGFGESNIDAALYAKKDSATFIFEGKLIENEYMFVGFHVPSTLSPDNPDTKLKLKITLVYDPMVNPDNDLEYSQSRVSMTIFKPTDSGKKETLVSADDKYLVQWNPIIQFEKEFTRSYLSGFWEIRLRLFVRGTIPANYLQDFAIVIEVIDAKNRTSVYDDVLQEYGYTYTPIILRIAA